VRVTSLPKLLTADLLLRHWRADDLAPLTSLFADPDFSWHPYRRARTPAEAARFLHRAQRHWLRRDIGVWAVTDRTGSELLGYGGVTETSAETWGADWEVGVRLASHAHGRGLGTQVLRAVLDDAFRRTGTSEVIATIEAGHARSERLFRRIGMQPSGQLPHPEFATPHTVMRLTRERWQREAG
jgi:RimJ/RimL family protein N-acetyltransferase